MNKIYLLWLTPQSGINKDCPYVYRAYDTALNAVAMGTSVLHEYDTPVHPHVTEVDFDGRLAQDVFPTPAPQSEVVRVTDPTVPGGLPPILDGQCPWCRKMCDPHFDLPMGLNMFHEICIREFHERASMLIHDEELPKYIPNNLGDY